MHYKFYFIAFYNITRKYALVTHYSTHLLNYIYINHYVECLGEKNIITIIRNFVNIFSPYNTDRLVNLSIFYI